jgi:ABC-2 type transport system permease protein
VSASAFWVLVRLRLLEVGRSRSTAAFVLVVPLVLLLVVGLVFAHGQPFARARITLVAGEIDGEARGAMKGVLSRAADVQVETAESRQAALPALTPASSAVVARDGDDLVVLATARSRLFAEGLVHTLAMHARVVTVPERPFGYVQFVFPGIVTFSALLSGLCGMGYGMVRYRQSLFLKKLATTPLGKATFVASQIAARTALVLAQTAVLVAGAALVFGLRVAWDAIPWLVLVIVLGLASFLGIGFMLSCVVKTEALMVDVISLVNMPLVLLSELFFPVDVLPRPLAWLGESLPTTHMVRLVRAVLLFGTTELGPLLVGLGVLAVWTAGTFSVSVALYRGHEGPR